MSTQSFGMPMPPREKRTAQLKGYVPPSLREHYEGKVTGRKSLSDLVYEALEQQAAIEIAKQKLTGRGDKQ